MRNGAHYRRGGVTERTRRAPAPAGEDGGGRREKNVAETPETYYNGVDCCWLPMGRG